MPAPNNTVSHNVVWVLHSKDSPCLCFKSSSSSEAALMPPPRPAEQDRMPRSSCQHPALSHCWIFPPPGLPRTWNELLGSPALLPQLTRTHYTNTDWTFLEIQQSDWTSSTQTRSCSTVRECELGKAVNNHTIPACGKSLEMESHSTRMLMLELDNGT